MNIRFRYDLEKKIFVNASGVGVAGKIKPEIAYGMKPVWEWEFINSAGEPWDISNVAAWRAAIDTDFRDETAPMCRTLGGITVVNNVVHCPMDALTTTYRDKANGRDVTNGFFDLTGFDAAGVKIFYFRCPVACLYVLDPEEVVDPLDPPETTVDAAQVEAIAQGVVNAALAAYTPPDGEPGPIGPAPRFEFSATGIAGTWHATWAPGDLYLRVSTDLGVTWQGPVPLGTQNATFPLVPVWSDEVTYATGALVAYGTPAGLYQAKEPVGYDQSPEDVPAKWQQVAGPGADGASSMWLMGSGAPTAEIGNDHDQYLDELYNHYRKVDGAWVQMGSIKGANGAGINHRGAWSAAAAYSVGDGVTSNGSVWSCTVPHTGQEPPATPEGLSLYWELFLARGTTGNPGPAGTVQIVAVNMLAPTADPYASEGAGSTAARRLYTLNLPRGSTGPAGSLRIEMGLALEPDEDPVIEELPGSTPHNRSYRVRLPMGQPGERGTGMNFNATGTLAGRVAYDGADGGFCYLATDILTDDLDHHYQAMYYKVSDAIGDWSDAIRLYAGQPGQEGKPGPPGIQGPPGENAAVKPAQEFIADDLYERTLIVAGTDPIATVEVYDVYGHAHALALGTADGEIAITTRADVGLTLVTFGPGVDLTYGGRIRFAQGLSGESLYQMWLATGHVGTHDDYLAWIAGQVSAGGPVTRVSLTRPTGEANLHLQLQYSQAGDFSDAVEAILTSVEADRGKVLFFDGEASAAFPADGLGDEYAGQRVVVDLSAVPLQVWLRYRWYAAIGEPSGAWRGLYHPSSGGVEEVVSAVQANGALVVSLTGTTAGRWSIDDGSTWHESGTALTLAPGSFTVTFQSVAGYVTPAPAAATIVAGQVTTISGDYVAEVVDPYADWGYLQVNTLPDSGQWSVDDGVTWHPSAAMLVLYKGSYTVIFMSVDDYGTPSPQTATVVAGQETSITVPYLSTNGFLKVTLTGTTDGRWSVDDGVTWHESDATVTLLAGDYTVTFQYVDGYTAPVSKNVTIVAAQLATTSAAYVSIYGTLKVTLTGSTDGRWSVDDGVTWHESDATVTLLAGDYTVTFQSVDGYTAPVSKNVTIVAAQLATTSAAYVVSSNPADYDMTWDNGDEPILAEGAKVIYVTASGAGSMDGSSWADAKAGVYAATLAANDSDVLFLQAGTYTSHPAPIENKSVRIYGGFDSVDGTWATRNGWTNKTIIAPASNAGLPFARAASGETIDVDGLVFQNFTAGAVTTTAGDGGVKNCVFDQVNGTVVSARDTDNCLFAGGTGRVDGDASRCVFNKCISSTVTGTVTDSAFYDVSGSYGAAIDCRFTNSDIRLSGAATDCAFTDCSFASSISTPNGIAGNVAGCHFTNCSFKASSYYSAALVAGSATGCYFTGGNFGGLTGNTILVGGIATDCHFTGGVISGDVFVVYSDARGCYFANWTGVSRVVNGAAVSCEFTDSSGSYLVKRPATDCEFTDCIGNYRFIDANATGCHFTNCTSFYSLVGANATSCHLMNCTCTDDGSNRGRIFNGSATCCTIARCRAYYLRGVGQVTNCCIWESIFNSVTFGGGTNNAFSSYVDAGSLVIGNDNTLVRFTSLGTVQTTGYSAGLNDTPLADFGDFRPTAGSVLIGAGVAVEGVTTDITGATRANPPTIGAYEGVND